jgi:peptidoglycan-associated lipoprotein
MQSMRKISWVASLVAAGLLVAGTAVAETDAELQAQRVAAAQALQAARDVGADQWTHTDLRLADESFIIQNYRLAKIRADEAREKTLALKRLASMTGTMTSSTTVIDRSSEMLSKSEMMAMMSKHDARMAQLEATANTALAAAQRAEAAATRAEATSLSALEQARQAHLMAKAAADRPVPASCACGDGGLKSDRKSGLKDVYFDTDSSTIRADSAGALRVNAQWLQANPTVAVAIGGYADERGTQGYNQALGQRRAQAARDALVAAGVAAERITIVSYGEDRPAVTGHNEAAWQWNRNAGFVAGSPPTASGPPTAR